MSQIEDKTCTLRRSAHGVSERCSHDRCGFWEPRGGRASAPAVLAARRRRALAMSEVTVQTVMKRVQPDADNTAPSHASIDLYWLPLGAEGHFVRLNGRLYEAVAARLGRRHVCD